MSAQQLNVEVIANNIANINTTSYKRSRAEFTDLFYQIDRMQGVPNRTGEAAVPEGAKLGLGVRSVAVRKLHMQGSLAQTGNPYDLAVNGRGWFQIAGPNGETLYTRAGAFNTNADRQLVTADGYTVDPTIIIPQGTVEVTVNESGQVYASWTTRSRPVRWVSSILPTLPMRPASIRSEATSIGRHWRPALRSSASPAIPDTERSISAIWRARTSIPSRKSPN
jgi:flagellar basal-body rod protein FlgG